MKRCQGTKLERARGAEKAVCGETVVQKGVFGESVCLSVANLRFALKMPESLRIN